MRPTTALTIAGSDSGGGAGIQADLKTFLDHRVYGMSVITALTAQNTLGVQAICPVPVDFMLAQLRSIRSDFPVDAIKIGMLADAEHALALANFLEQWENRPPIVLDPVMVAKGGAALLKPDAVAVIRERLAPIATIVTPNIPEAEVLGSFTAASILKKGGHAEGDTVEDVLIHGTDTFVFRNRRVATHNTHGTGCTLSSAIAAGLASKKPLVKAVEDAIGYVADLIRVSRGGLGHGHGPLFMAD